MECSLNWTRILYVVQGALQWLQKAAVAALEISPGVVNILDLGSASGKNSAGELRLAVEALRKAEVLQLSNPSYASPGCFVCASQMVVQRVSL